MYGIEMRWGRLLAESNQGKIFSESAKNATTSTVILQNPGFGLRITQR